MRLRPIFWICLGLLLAAGIWFFWPHTRNGPPGSSPAITSAAPIRLPSSAAIKSAATAPKLLTNVSTNAAAKTNQFAYRLSNTKKTIGELVNDPHAILLENAFIDTRAALNLPIPKNLQAQGDPGAYIVQAPGPIDGAFRALLAAAGARIVSYIPNNAYLVEISAAGAAGLSANSMVQTVVPYEPYYKLSPSLLAAAMKGQALPDGMLLQLRLFSDTAAQTIKQIEQAGGTGLTKEETSIGTIVTVIPGKNWTAIPQLAGVQNANPLGRRAAANDLSRVTLGISTNTITAANYLGLSGLNVTVEVNDSGIDATHPDLATRVFGDFASSLVDTNGHGTEVAGIIASSGVNSKKPPGPTAVGAVAQGSVTNADFRGKAPAAKLYSVAFLDVNGNSFDVPDQYLQETPARTNALISNNSWIFTDDNEYDLAAASYDAAVRDALPEVTGSQPVLFVFAAGNNGGGTDGGIGGASDSILSPGTAKNVITVGALEQVRNITNIVTDINGNSNAVWLGQSDTGSQVAFYSSRGNVGIGTEGSFGRFKPDVVAPGSFVVSTRSSQWDQAAYYNPTNFYSQEFDDQFIRSNSIQHESISLNFFPPDNITFRSNVVAVDVQILPSTASSATFSNLLIYVSHTSFPVPTNSATYDFVRTNGFSIPPDGGGSYLASIQNGNLFLTIVNSNSESVDYDFTTQITTTNENGNYFQVLSNLNNTLGPDYRYESGTSIAAPAVSGVLALMQDYFTNVLHTTPSPALLKAMLINGARPVGSYTYSITNGINFEGWGGVNIQNSLPPGFTNRTGVACSSFILDQSPTNALATGDSHTFVVTVDTNSFGEVLPLQVTLAWTDPPGDPAAAIKLVNNLDLVITNLDTGEIYFGNDILPGNTFNQPSDTNFPPNLDAINNVENIIIPPLLGGSYSITVIGRGVNVNAVTAQTNNATGVYAPNVVQDFALMVSCGKGEVPNAINVTDAGIISKPTTDQQITLVTATNTPLLNQFVGANTPLLGTNQVQFGSTNELVTLGMTNQWHFYVITNNAFDSSGTNTSDVTNAAFVTFLPDELSVPRMGVFADSTDNATRPEADIDLYVSTDSSLTNLNPVVISNCVNGTQIGATVTGKFNGASLSRGGTEFVVDTNSTHGQVYYVGVKSEDQVASEYAFLPVFTATPFSTIDGNGNEIVNGLALPVSIPDGSPDHPGIGYVFGLAIQPVEVENVIVSDVITHQNFGDLLGTLSHNGVSDVLNNHDSLGNPPGPYPFIYDDSGSGQFSGTQPSDGPGSLQSYTGTEAIGPWILTEADDTLTQTGAVTAFQLTIQPHVDLTGGQTVTIQPHTWFYGFVDVPVGYTNLTVVGIDENPHPPNYLDLFVKEGLLPTLVDTNDRVVMSNTVLTPVSGSGATNSVGPPLQPDRYFVGIFNPDSGAHTVFVKATLHFSPLAIEALDFNSSGATTILDDAVVTSSINVTNTDLIQSLNVGLRVDHPRISDLVFHLISPDGTRYLLMENRGGTSTNGAGATIGPSNYVYLAFTEDTNLTTTPIKFAPTPFVPSIDTNSVGYVQWSISAGGNGHWYKAVTNSTTSPLDWDQADQVAHSEGGYLATITSSAENNFVFSLIDSPNFFSGFVGNGSGPAIGGVQTNGAPEPDGGWTWETGEPWNYTNWAPGTPDNADFANENRVAYISGVNGVAAPTWNDIREDNINLGGYVIEKDTITVPINLYYLPEQSIAPLNGQNAFGTWQLEIQDDRAGAGLTNSLVSWQLEFTFANTNLVPTIPLTNDVPATNVVPANSISWFLVTVPPNADIATNDLIFATAPVNLLFNPSAPDTNGDFTLLPNAINGLSILTTSSAPTNIVPGGIYFLGVQNTNNFAVTNAVEVDFHLFAASSPFAFTQPAQSITGTSAQLNGMATPNGLPATAWFEWGTNTSYGNQTPSISVGNSFNVVYVTNQISLVPNVSYHFRLVVSNALAVVDGFDQILDEANVVVWGANFAGQIFVPPGLSNVVAIAGAYDHSLALRNNGTVATWGDDTFNQTNVPAALNANLVAVAGGESYSLALKNSGTVVAWGANIFPGETNVPTGLNNVVTIASGQYTSLALQNNGAVVAWGANISGLTNVPANAINTVAIAGGSFHNLALRNDGTVVAWGDDSVGQTNVPPGLTNVVAISGGSFHSLALRNDGTVVAWGDDTAGQTNVPVGLTNVVAIAAGGFHSLALKNDGTVVAWGDGSAGQTDVPQGLNRVVAIAGGNLHSLALTPLFNLNSTNPIVLNPSGGAPQTNSILPGSITYYQVNVPVNADFATNLLLSANGPLNVLFTTNTPPATNGAIVLLAGSTNGVSVLSRISAPTNIVPGAVYYLGVQNTNGFTVTYGIEVDFHLLTAPPVIISSITPTNIGGKFGFLLTWFAPTNDIFQVQETPSLAPASWQTFTNIITYTGPPTPTNGLFSFFDDGTQFPFGPTRFYRLILLNSLTNGAPQTNSAASNSITWFSITVPANADFATNLLVSATLPVNLLFNQTTLPTGTNAGDFTLLTNSIGGSTNLSSGTTPPLVPGSTYYLGVQNTNNVAVNFTLEVNFHLAPAAAITNYPVSGIIFSNGSILLTWFAPTNYQFQVQWTTNLAPPASWTTVPGVTLTNVSFFTPTNGVGEFQFLDDGSLTGGFGSVKFYRLIAYPPGVALPSAAPLVLSNARAAAGGIQFQWTAPTNLSYEIAWTTNLGTPFSNWLVLTNPVFSVSNGVFTFLDTNQTGPSTTVKFFRLLEQ